MKDINETLSRDKKEIKRLTLIIIAGIIVFLGLFLLLLETL
jgi:hypothetical protein